MYQLKAILSTFLRNKVGTLLIVAQIAITLGVSINAFNIIQDRADKMGRDTGLDEDQLFSFNVTDARTDINLEQSIRLDLQLLREQSSIEQAIAINQIPLSGSGDSTTFAASREDHRQMKGKGATNFRSDHRLLETLGLQLVAGRNFTEEEVEYTRLYEHPKAVIITQSLADKLYPDGAVGKLLYYGTGEAKIVGVVANMAGPWLHSSLLYDSVLGPLVPVKPFSRYLVRVKPGQLESTMAAVEDILLKRDPNRVISFVRSFADHKYKAYRGDIAMSYVLKAVVFLLVAVTALGIVGMVNYNVSRRFKQIGTRRALGASESDIVRYFLSEIALLCFIGTLLGGFISSAISQYLKQDYDIPLPDLPYYGFGIAIMFACALAATWLPAKRASLISPAVATQSC